MASSTAAAMPRTSGHCGNAARKKTKAAKGAALTNNGARFRFRTRNTEPGTTVLLRVHDVQGGRLAHRLRAVQYVQLAQRLLHVVLHAECADLEDHADIDVALPVVEPLQDLRLAGREQPRLRRLVG